MYAVSKAAILYYVVISTTREYFHVTIIVNTTFVKFVSMKVHL